MSNKQNRFSVGKKMYLFIILTLLIASFGTAVISYRLSADQIDSYYKSITIDSARNFASLLDADYLRLLRDAAASEEFQQLRDAAEEEDDEAAIETYLREHELWDGYAATRKQLMNYLGNMDDIKYLYIVAPGDANAEYDMYLVDDEENPLYETGYYEPREAEFAGVDFSRTELPPSISNGDWGWLCSAFAPVFDASGEFVCIVGCDVGMDDIMSQRHHSLLYILIGALIFSAVVLACAVWFIRRIAVKPLNLLTAEMRKFKPAENISYEQAGVAQLDLKNNDEISDLYQGIRTMQINIIDYLNNMSALQKDKERAESDVKAKEIQIGQISQEAYRDVLTGVGSKTAYTKKIAQLNADIEEGHACFALVMVDLNDLKRINDKYGHKAGDSYIKGCCRMICERYKHSPIYRIGGDEFIIILQGRDYENRFRHLEDIKAEFEAAYSKQNCEPWERYSASIGMADYASDDNTVELVFKQADREMYENKKAFKQQHGSYR
ncbi:MAG: diguanylate cyclase [Oscillospiraceae bacterium]|nr:diguanylate cyclase [Oscillospiraceae bacterium]